MTPYGIHWFRRDLRIAGNPAFSLNYKQNGKSLVGLFVFDKAFLSRPDFSANRFQFFLATLQSLRTELRELGSDLLVLDVGPDTAFEDLFARLGRSRQGLPALVTWNRDYEPFARSRDEKREKWLTQKGVRFETDRDHLLIEPHEITKGDSAGGTYQVFTPFARRWYDFFSLASVQERVAQQKQGIAFLDKRAKGKTEPLFSLTWPQLLTDAKTDKGDLLKKYLLENGKRATISLPAAGSQAALTKLRAFAPKLAHYGEGRDIPGIDGTSQLSPYFKNGSLTVAQVIAELGLVPDSKKTSTGGGKYLSELVWREFYYHILFHHPRVEHSAFLEKYANLPWRNREDWFLAWKEGKTGFPIVDAAMRQLKQTGWMHNRARMIVASFLTKDLLIDWRWGERYFMEALLDGDLAPNNGGWQWAASTGCDPQPYFRVFNPKLQSQKFDPKGDYIRKYIPELRQYRGKDIHEPPPLERGEYPQAIVDHSEQRDEALALYKGA